MRYASGLEYSRSVDALLTTPIDFELDVMQLKVRAHVTPADEEDWVYDGAQPPLRQAQVATG
jgi:hypothetical protein